MNDLRGATSAASPAAGTMVPPATFPELFEAQVRATPRSPAIESAGRSWTYEELNVRANRIAHWLIGRRIGSEHVVAVAMPRSAEQIAVLLGILKAGAGYLPWDLSYPRERIAHMADDAIPAVVLTTQGVARQLPAGPNTDIVTVDTPSTAAAWQRAAKTDPGDADRCTPLRPAHTAYIIYTSGSTGRPKGVTVTHAGLAALRAEALRIGGLDGPDGASGARVLQFASLSFDMSVWDLVLALTTGAALVVPPQDRLIGADLAEVLAAHGVTHATLPPSVLATLPPGTAGALDQMRVMVVGGEACTPGLVTEWGPGRRFINAYGPTEATVWATFSGPLSDGAVPIGTAMTDARVYVLDERLEPVTDGQPGELYLAGPGLARGYLGRWALTATRFVADPFGPAGARMYRTGDMACVGTEGQMEHLGRGDDQIKVRGQRIELGEVEAALETHPRVRRAVAAAHDSGDGRGKQLVGYVVPMPDDGSAEAERRGATGSLTLERGLGAAELRSFLLTRLPEGMVPGTVTVIDEVPLTPNGKVDRAALPPPEFRGGAYRPPRSPLEEALADVFAEVLSASRVGVDDDFFSLGGDSIQSVRIIAGARTRGVTVSARQIFELRTVAALAETVAATRRAADVSLGEPEAGEEGRLPHLPATRSLRDSGPVPARSAQAMLLELPEGMDRTRLADGLGAVIDHHDMLRARLVEADGGGFVVGAPGTVDVDALIHRVVPPQEDEQDGARHNLLQAELDAATRRLDPAAGVMTQFVWFDAGAGRTGRLLAVLHCLVVDDDSWRILTTDLALAWQQIRDGSLPELAPVVTSVRRWAHALVQEAGRPERVVELDRWRSTVEPPALVLGARRPAVEGEKDVAVDVAPMLSETRVRLTAGTTEVLLNTLPSAFRCRIEDGLLAALAMAVMKRRDRCEADTSSLLIRTQMPGRAEAAVPGTDLSRTVGPLTGVVPVRLDISGADLEVAFAGGPAVGTVLKTVKEQVRGLPDQGIGYSLLRHLNPKTAAVLERHGSGQISFRYRGRLSAVGVPAEPLEPDVGRDPRPFPRDGIDIEATVIDTADGPCLGARFTVPEDILPAAEARDLAETWRQALEALGRHAARPGAGGLTPSDVPLVTVEQDDLDEWWDRFPGLSDIWPVPPMPMGLLVHSMMGREAGAEIDTYQIQYMLRLSGPVDPVRMHAAAQALLDRHAALRAAYEPGPDGDLVRLVVDDVELPWRQRDLRGFDKPLRDAEYERFLERDLAEQFDPGLPPMLRMSLLTLAADRHELVMTAHHANVDGWCLALLVRDLLHLYARGGDASALPPPRSYGDYLAWLARQDARESAQVWAKELAGLEGPTLLAPGAVPPAGGTYVGRADVPLPAAAARALPRHAAELGVTLNTLVQGAWAVVLSRLTSRQDVVLAAVTSGRPAGLPGAESIIGTFINTVPVRVPCAPGDSVARMLTDLQGRQGALLGHHHYGFSEIHRAAGLAALTDSLIAFESFPLDRERVAEAGEAAGIAVTDIGLYTLSHFPVTVFAYPDGAHLRLTLQYQRHLFSREKAEEMGTLFGRVLHEIAVDPRLRLRDLVRS
ncbi:amino acid adenylation domain-containing protein [Streptomyces sp. NPDC056669]|uniref:amino acid adenylation domain-containing protein n=1 Tax=Streptomyces sp. NPDC056669 TaxID=3345903 RepID=UPI0036C0E754